MRGSRPEGVGLGLEKSLGFQHVCITNKYIQCMFNYLPSECLHCYKDLDRKKMSESFQASKAREATEHKEVAKDKASEAAGAATDSAKEAGYVRERIVYFEVDSIKLKKSWQQANSLMTQQ